jgi:hypothetical protein
VIGAVNQINAVLIALVTGAGKSMGFEKNNEG